MQILRASIIALSAAASTSLAQDVSEGAEIFSSICATCHGLTAVGNGPMAAILLVQPADLTTLTQRNDGIFPTFRVATSIDGRDPMVSHGSEMPVFGDFFEGVKNVPLKSNSGQPILVSQPIGDVVVYLQSIQK
ncbi:MAG: c-type cytochrome [Sulfitobacter sp.]|nr:c-type cytochrome [Sulfitobacter sp.]